jgi:hypothetical protein
LRKLLKGKKNLKRKSNFHQAKSSKRKKKTKITKIIKTRRRIKKIKITKMKPKIIIIRMRN